MGGAHNTGRLEIIMDDEVGTICDQGWSRYDATVACRQLGFTGGEFKRYVPRGGDRGMRGLLKYSNKRGSEFCSPITKLPLSKWNVLFGLRTFQETTWRKFHFIMVTPPIHYKMDRFQKMSFWRNLHSLILLLLMIVYFQTNFRFLSDLLPAARELDA